MRLWPKICIGAAFFAAIALADQLSAIHEKRKAAYIEAVRTKLAKSQETRLVASFESTDWISPVSKITTLVYAIPSQQISIFGQDKLFGLMIVTYGTRTEELVVADCKARTQTFVQERGKPHTIVHEPEGQDKSPKTLPGWIPGLCSDWSPELAASRRKHRRQGA
jgi:hypothetical protein